MIANRLSAADVTNLALEAPDTLMHQAALGVLDGAPLLDAEGHVRIDAVLARLGPKVAVIPELHHVVHRTGLAQGRPLWVDDASFALERHVRVATLPPPGGEARALELLDELMATPMDRSRPLWEVWLLEGYAPGKVGIVAKTHHALADGPAMINLVAQLFDLEPDAPPPPDGAWIPVPPPRARALIADNFQGKARGLARGLRRLRHPIRLFRSTAETLHGGWEMAMRARHAPRTSLNQPIGVPRRVAVYAVPLSDMKLVAHAAGVKVNDAFLAIVAGALGEVMTARGERTDGVALHASIAVSMHVAGDPSMAGNKVGTVVVPLPVGRMSPAERMAAIAAGTMVAKSTQRAVITPALMWVLARTGVTRTYIRHQHMVNILTTNLHGPPFPLYVAGARLLHVYAVPPIAGNVALSFAAISYEGELTIAVIADAAAFPDLDVLMRGVRTAWSELKATVAGVPLAVGL